MAAKKAASIEERALIAQMTESKTKKPLPAAMQYAFETVTNWPDAARCRLAIEAVLSHALDSQSPLHKQARSWVNEKRGTRDPNGAPLVSAVLLLESSYSKEARERVWKYFFDPDGFLWEKRCWNYMRDQQMSWTEICKTIGVAENWLAFPPANRASITGMCRRLFWCAASDTHAGRVREIIASAPAEMQTLLHFAVNCAVWECNSEELLQEIAQSEKCYPAILAVLRSERHTFLEHYSRGGADWKIGLAGLRYLAKMFIAAVCLKHDPTLYEQWLKPLTRLNVSWVWENIGQLCEWSETQPDAVASQTELLQTAFVALINYSTSRNDELSKALHPAQEAFASVLATRPPVVKAQIHTLAITLGRSNSEMLGNLQGLPLRHAVIDESAEVYRNELGAFIRENPRNVSEKLILDYVEVFPGPESLALFQGWLNAPVSRSCDLPTLDRLINAVIAHRLQPGSLFVEHAQTLLERGYKLTQTDVEQTGNALFPAKQERWIAYVVSARWLWENQQWRKAILQYVKEEAMRTAIGSLIITWEEANRYPQDRFARTLRLALINAGEKRAELKQAFVQFALDCKDDYSAKAREWLFKKDRWQTWVLDKNILGRFCREWLVDMRAMYPHVIDAVLTSADQRAWLFGLTQNSSSEHEVSLPDPKSWVALFPKDEEIYVRLRRWLVVHAAKFRVMDWLKWVRCFELKGDPAVKRHLESLLDGRDEEEVVEALNLLGYSGVEK